MLVVDVIEQKKNLFSLSSNKIPKRVIKICSTRFFLYFTCGYFSYTQIISREKNHLECLNLFHEIKKYKTYLTFFFVEIESCRPLKKYLNICRPLTDSNKNNQSEAKVTEMKPKNFKRDAKTPRK